MWNTFPVPALNGQTRQRNIDTGQLVLQARDQHPERSLAEYYNPLALAMSLELVKTKAHEKLDREVDKVFGASRKFTTARQRQELLFVNYVGLTNEA